MKQKILVIDGDNMAHRALHRFGTFTTKAGNPSGVIFGVPFMINSLMSRFYPTTIYAVFDGGKAAWRKKLLPNYKVREHRIDVDYEAFLEQKEDLIELLSNMGVRVIREHEEEADDIIAVLTKRLEGYLCIVSSDKDFHQLISPLVTLWKPSITTLLTTANTFEVVGYEPHECVDWLCLDGDKSDKIPGIKGMGKVRIRQFLDKYGSIEEFLDSEDQNFGTLSKKVFQKTYALNNRLINLHYAYRRHWRKKTTPKFLRVGFSREVVLMLLRKYEVNLLNRPGLISNFTKLQ